MLKSLFLPILAAATFIILVGLLTQGKFSNFIKPTSDVNEKTKVLKISDIEINIEIAKTSEERAKGLGGRDSLDENSGMLFVFDENTKPTFWMRNTNIALDIIWINDNKIVGIDKNIQPEIGVKDSDLKKYPAPSEIDTVLEVNEGFSEQKGFKIGDSVDLIE